MRVSGAGGGGDGGASARASGAEAAVEPIVNEERGEAALCLSPVEGLKQPGKKLKETNHSDDGGEIKGVFGDVFLRYNKVNFIQLVKTVK